jgi:hypothetical protein
LGEGRPRSEYGLGERSSYQRERGQRGKYLWVRTIYSTTADLPNLTCGSSLLRTLQRERGLVKSLVDLGLTSSQAIELLMYPAHSATQNPSIPLETPRKGTTRGSAKAFVVQDDGVEIAEKKTFAISPKFTEFLDGLIDASDRQEGGGVVLYWNDLEEDQRYAAFSPSLQGVRIVFTSSFILTRHMVQPASPRPYDVALFAHAQDPIELGECYFCA